MQLNKFLWDLYKKSEEGETAIQLFAEGQTDHLLEKYLGSFHMDVHTAADYIDDLIDFTTSPAIPEQLSIEEAKSLFNTIISKGITLTYGDEEQESLQNSEVDFLDLIHIISTWLYRLYPDFYKPYFFVSRFHLLTRIADSFSIELPPVPLRRYKDKRLEYYWQLCESFLDFQDKNGLTAAEFCAFLYDFAPKYIAQNDEQDHEELPKPTQVWMIGGDKSGSDFEFLDKASADETSHWQGNEDTKRGDILIMYCLAPRSYIHSIWRATADGIADPFFYWYSSIYIGEGVKIEPISHKDLKNDPYFSQHPLIRKNLQGLNGYQLTSQDYLRLQQMIAEKGGSTTELPQLYSHSFDANRTLTNEREVEIALIEPLLTRLGYTSNDWVRQLPVRMGRGERNFPDYAFLLHKEPGYEVASMLIESKFWIKNNREIEDAFKQVWSYGLRLSAKILVIADKDAIWIYHRQNEGFDRTRYIKKFWLELEQPDTFNLIKKLIGKP